MNAWVFLILEDIEEAEKNPITQLNLRITNSNFIFECNTGCNTLLSKAFDILLSLVLVNSTKIIQRFCVISSQFLQNKILKIKIQGMKIINILRKRVFSHILFRKFNFYIR